MTLQCSSIEECICILACFSWRICYKRIWFRWRVEERLDSASLFKNLQQRLSAHSIPQTSIRHHQMLHNRQPWIYTLLTAFMSYLCKAMNCMFHHLKEWGIYTFDKLHQETCYCMRYAETCNFYPLLLHNYWMWDWENHKSFIYLITVYHQFCCIHLQKSK